MNNETTDKKTSSGGSKMVIVELSSEEQTVLEVIMARSNTLRSSAYNITEEIADKLEDSNLVYSMVQVDDQHMEFMKEHALDQLFRMGDNALTLRIFTEEKTINKNVYFCNYLLLALKKDKVLSKEEKLNEIKKVEKLLEKLINMHLLFAEFRLQVLERNKGGNPEYQSSFLDFFHHYD